MDIRERVVGSCVILDITGKITCDGGDALLEDKVNSLVARGCRRIVLNMAGVTRVDSPGLGTIVGCLTTLRKLRGGLKLVKVGEALQNLLAITKLVAVFETFESEQAALASFNASAGP